MPAWKNFEKISQAAETARSADCIMIIQTPNKTVFT